MKLIRIGLLLIASMSTIGVILAPISANALSGSDFKAGRIIDDAIFTNKNSMTVAQIQQFLSAKVPTCEVNHAAYNASNPPPYTCLKDYQENTTTGENNFGRYVGSNPYQVPGGKSAAQIIWEAGQTYNINPQVLIVLLQKEQGLVTDTWPLLSQFTKATGYLCPDTAACNSNAGGFGKQVFGAAWQFRNDLNGIDTPSFYSVYGKGLNNIRYSPDPACGTRSVYIENQATAVLYKYTPYTPNDAALAVMNDSTAGGTVNCGAYGNRNFFWYFTKWFGSTLYSPFFSNNGRVYIAGANNTYYYVPSQELLQAYGFGTIFPGISPASDTYLSGLTYKGNLPWVARFDGLAIYAVDNTQIHQFMTESDYFNYGYSFGQEAVLPSYMQNLFSTSSQMSTVLRRSNESAIYLIANGQKHHIGTERTYYSSGSPVYSSLPNTILNSAYLQSIQEGAPLLADGTAAITSDTNKYSIIYGNKAYPTSKQVLDAWNVGYDTYTRDSAIISKFELGATLGKFAKDSNGQLFLLDNYRKFILNSDQQTSFGADNAATPVFPQNLLDRFATTSMTRLVQKKGLPSVYQVASGKLYHIYAEDDLIGLGYQWSEITTLNSELPLDSGAVFRQGKLVRIQGLPEVYLLDTGFKKLHIPNEATLYNYGFNFSNVAIVGSGDLKSYTTGSPLNRFVTDGNKKWLIDSGYKREVTEPQRISYGFAPESFVNLSDGLLSKISTSNGSLQPLVRASGKLEVYKIEGGTKRWITSESALTRNGYNFSMVMVLSQDFVNSLPTAANIN